MSTASPLDLEEELKASNPKGRLWEACSARRVAPPSIRHAASGTRHRVEMELTAGDWELSSGVHWGWSRKVAEQLAARALLAEFEALDEAERASSPPPPEQAEGDDVFEVDARDVSRLRESNPKGQVFEWCQRQKPAVRRPRFEVRQAGGAVLVRGRLETLGLESPWFRAPRRKEAEQAAAEGLLGLLPAPAAADALEVDATTTANPRSVLNALVQGGGLAECRVDIIGRRGADHAPQFVAQGWARLIDGREVETEQREGPSKRAAIGTAAEALLSLVRGG